MTAFDDLFQEAAAPPLLDQFGESVVYIPRDGRPREITAIIVREPLQRLSAVPGALSPSTVAKVRNNAVTGILASEVNNGDKLEYAIRKGGEMCQRAIGGTAIVKGGLTYIEVK